MSASNPAKSDFLTHSTINHCYWVLCCLVLFLVGWVACLVDAGWVVLLVWLPVGSMLVGYYVALCCLLLFLVGWCCWLACWLGIMLPPVVFLVGLMLLLLVVGFHVVSCLLSVTCC